MDQRSEQEDKQKFDVDHGSVFFEADGGLSAGRLLKPVSEVWKSPTFDRSDRTKGSPADSVKFLSLGPAEAKVPGDRL